MNSCILWALEGMPLIQINILMDEICLKLMLLTLTALHLDSYILFRYYIVSITHLDP